MKNFNVFVFTDLDRRNFTIGICNSITELNSLKNKSLVFYDVGVLTNRLVYFEKFKDQLSANKQVDNLRNMPRVLLMKMIRKRNPNWLDIWQNNYLVEMASA